MDNQFSKVKKLVAKLITDILHVDEAAIDEYDNLVEIGVDSLIVMDINSKLGEKYGVQIQISQFFGGINTIADIAQYIIDNGNLTEFQEVTATEPAPAAIIRPDNTAQPYSTYPHNPFSSSTIPSQDVLMQQISNMVYQMMVSNQITGKMPVPSNNVPVQRDEPNKIMGNSEVDKESEASENKGGRKPYVAHRKIDGSRKEHTIKVKNAIDKLAKEFNEKTKSSKEFAVNNRMAHADWRNVAGFRLDYKELLYQLVAQNCNGSRITDIDGNEYIDITMGFGVNLFGYKPDFVIEAVKNETDNGFPLGMISSNISDVSNLICELTGMERTAYFNSGTEAVMVAVRVARAKTLKKKIVYFSGAYHGTFDGVLGIKGSDYRKTYPISVGIPQGITDDIIVLDYDDKKSLKIIEEHADEIAGVLLESVQSRNPSLQPREFVVELRRITKKNNIALIFDEMITGFRISAGGAQEFYGVKGDIATYGKIVGGGMPIGVVAGMAEYMDCLDGGMWNYGDDSVPPMELHRPFLAGTFCHHPLSMAAAKAVLTKIKYEKDTIYPDVNRKTMYLAEKLNTFFEEEQVPIKITYFGSLFRFEFQGNIEVFYYYMLMHGVYIWEGRNCFISTAHTDEDIEQIIAAVKKVVKEMQEVFFPKALAEQPLAVSKQQAAMIAAMSFVSGQSQYNQNALFEVGADFDETVFTDSVKRVLESHDFLNVSLNQDRTGFIKVKTEFQLAHIAWEGKAEEEEFQKLINIPFDIYSERGVRINFIEDAEGKYLLFVAHHLFIDGFSLIQMMQEVSGYYNAAISSSGSLKLKKPLKVHEYETIKAKLIEGLDKEEIHNFWKEYLSNTYDLLLPRTVNNSSNVGKRLSEFIHKVKYLDIKTAASNYNCTPFVLMLSAANILLYKICGQKKITVAVPFAGQLLATDRSLMGYFDKIVPIVTDILPEFRVKDIIYQNMNVTSKLNDYKYMFEEICDEKTVMSMPNINVMFNLDTLPSIKIADQNIKVRTLVQDTVLYDLMINLILADNEITIDFDYNGDKFAEEQVQAWLNGYMEILSMLIAGSNMNISGIRCLSTAAEKEMVSSVNSVVNSNPQFESEIKGYDSKSISFVIVDSYHRLKMLGSVGIIGVYTQSRELFLTSYYGRVTSNFQLEIIDKKENTVSIHDIIISKTQIETVIMKVDGVENAVVSRNEKNQIAADVYSKDNFEITRSELRQICVDHLPLYMCPSEFYIITRGIRTLMQQDELNTKEKEISDICSDSFGLYDIGADENIIALGANSIQMLKFFSAIQDKYGVRLSFSLFLKEFTISAVTKVLEELTSTELSHENKIVATDKKEYYAASSAQKRLFIEYQLNKESVTYNLPIILYFNGAIRADSIQDAFAKIIKRNAILRTYFSIIDGEIVQIISDTGYFEFNVIDSNLDVIDDKYIEEQMQLFVRPFVLEKLPLIRVLVLNSTEKKTVILFDIHHIVFDGLSEELLLNELISYLNHEELEELTIQYKDYSEWQQKSMSDVRIQQQEKYWSERFVSGIPTCKLESDIMDSPSEINIRGRCIFNLSELQSQELNEFCKEINCTPSIFLLSVFGFVLKTHLYSDNILFGVTLEGRNQYQIQNMIGFFVTNLPYLIEFEEDIKVNDYIEKVKKEFYELLDNSDVPLERIMEVCGRVRTNKEQRLFDINFTYQDYYEQYYIGETEIIPVEYSVKHNMFDLDCEIINEKGNYQIIFKYNKGLFYETTINRILQHFICCASAFRHNYKENLSAIDIAEQNEKDTILNVFNGTDAEFSKDRTVVQIFEEQVAKTPNNIAVLFEDKKLTYAELNKRANCLARKLREECGVRSDDYVVIMAERSLEMIVGIYAILKAGGAYVPIDPMYPADRIEYMLNDCRPKAVLIYNAEIKTDIPIIHLSESSIFEGNQENLEHISKPNDPAYVIYTSGTTGKPKGVIIENQGLINRIQWMDKRYPIETGDVILQKTTYTFDVSVWEIIWWSLKGAAVSMLIPGGEKDPKTICEAIERDRVTVMHFVPSMLSFFEAHLEEDVERVRALHSLRFVFASGEALKPEHAKKFKQLINERNKNTMLINVYGPTEASIDVSYYECQGDEDIVPIGKPISNIKLYIWNQNNLCGIGVPGELCIAGIGLARGYLNKAELTEEKFVDNPFGEGRMYRTGDLAKWQPDGNIEYLGRIDDQVKIRGFRIELGEIESRIKEINAIKDCVVIAKPDKNGDQAIYAYYVSDGDITTEDIKTALRLSLPAYMIPAYMMQIDKIPVTANGKRNKKALPNIDTDSDIGYVAPRNLTERILCNIFKEVLNSSRVGIYDNYFEMGGHSLNAIRAMNRIDMELGVRITLETLLEYQSPKALAEKITINTGGFERITPAEHKKYYPMSSSQKRLFIINEMEQKTTAYNMPAMFEFGEKFDAERMRYAIAKLMKRHEMFRTTFQMMDSEPTQIIHEEGAVDFQVMEASEDEISRIFDIFIRPFEVSQLPLMRILIVNVSDSKHFMLFDMHHLVSDEISNDIIFNEMFKLYDNQELEPMTLHYKDYSEWLRKRDLSSQKAYWIDQFSDEIPVLNLPIDYKRPLVQSFRGRSFKVGVPEDIGIKIKELSRVNKATNYMIFLSAAMVLLSKYSRQEDIVIGTLISGRTHQDMEPLIGMFVNTLAMRGKPKKKLTYSEFLREIKASCLTAYMNQEFAFEDLVESITVIRDMSRNPLFDVMVEMQNTVKMNLSVDGEHAELVEWDNSTSLFDFTFSIDEVHENQFTIRLEYCTDLFKQETAERIVEHYIEVIGQLTSEPEMLLEEVEVITEKEKNQILNDFNNTATQYQKEKTVVDLFEEQVQRTPDHVAVVYEGNELTYKELNEKANALAYELRELGIQPNEFVAIIGERCNEFMIGLYGVFKSGGAYVPINVNYPNDRIEYIIEDCKPKAVIIIADEEVTAKINVPVIHLKGRPLDNEPLNPERVHTPENYSHCFYTSGTTGKPKGAINLHRGLINRILWTQSKYPIGEDDVMLQKTTITFDDSLCELLWWSFFGARLIMLENEGEKDPIAMCNAIERNLVSVIYIVPTVLSFFISTVEKFNLHNNIKSLRYVFVSGEELKPDHVRDFHRMTAKLGSDIPLINTYGPTEASIDCTYFVCDKDYEEIPIGRPMSDTQMYIMQGNSLCGIGIPGELCVGGILVGAGYLNRKDLTEEVFVKNPYAEGTMYRTGDLAQWMPDGNLRFLGRIDEQIKIHGQRVELGEIESKIREIEHIKDSTVLAKDDPSGSKALYAYYVSDKIIEVNDIREKLGNVLPDYMVPTYMMQIDKIPVTLNGKVDKRALPSVKLESANVYIEPSTDEEFVLQKAFSNVIGISPISVDDNFFILGGDSIKAIRIVSSIREMGYDLTVKSIMTLKTIRLIAPHIKRIDMVQYDQEELSGIVDYLPAQKALLDEQLPLIGHYNQSLILEFDGHVNEMALRLGLSAIVEHHDALRTVFYDGIQEIKKVQDSALFELTFIEGKAEDNERELIENHCNQIQRSMDLKHGPLVKVCVFKEEKNDHLFFCIHHLVVDGVSWRILLEDLSSAYAAAMEGNEIRLPRKTASVKEWIRSLMKYRESRKAVKEREYWSNIICRMPDAMLKLNSSVNYEGYMSDKFSLESADGISLNKANQAYGTDVQDLLLSALGIAIERFTGQNTVAVELEGHGREEFVERIDVNRTIGFFTSSYPVIINCAENISDTITSNKEMLRSIPNNGSGYRILENDIHRPDILFNYLGDYKDFITGNDIFKGISEYPSGQDISEKNAKSYHLTIDCYRNNDTLTFEIAYSNIFNSYEIEQLMKNYKESIHEIMEHCISAEKVIMTGSDFGDSRISMDDLSALDDLLNSL